MKVRVLVTGGTIDKIHDPITETLAFSDTSHIHAMLRECNAHDVVVETLMLIDSLEVGLKEQREILLAISGAPEKRIVVTDGTSRMAEMAAYLAEVFYDISDKVVVITGALRPYLFSKSEPSFNMGEAIIAARVLLPGIYVVMNGRLFADGEVIKDMDSGAFRGRDYNPESDSG